MMMIKGTSINQGTLVVIPMMKKFSGAFSVNSIDRRYRSIHLRQIKAL